MMDGRDRRDLAPARRVGGRPDDVPRHVLAVSLPRELLRALPRHILVPGATIDQTVFPDLEARQLIGPQAPDLILSPLLTPRFDALDVARLLSLAGFEGRYLALVDQLPSANLIRREVAAQSPGLNFDVVVMDGRSDLHSL